jgi:hypothetical protein
MDTKELQDFQKAIGLAFEKSLTNFARIQRGTIGGPSGREPRESKDPAEEKRAGKRETESQSPQIKKNARLARNIGEAQKELFEATSTLADLTNSQIKKSKKGQAALERANDSIEQMSMMLADSLEKSAASANALINEPLRELYDSFKEMKKNSLGFAEGLAVNQKHASKIAAAMLSTHREVERGTPAYRSMIHEMRASSSVLDKQFLKTAGLIDEKTQELKDNISLEEFSKLRLMLGDTQATLTQAFSNLGIEKLENFFDNPEALVAEVTKRKNKAASEGVQSEEKFNESLVRMAFQLEATGHDLGLNLVKFENGVAQLDEERAKNLKNLEFSEIAAKLGNFSSKIAGATKQLDAIAFTSNTLVGKLGNFIKNIPNIPREFVKGLADSAVVMANFAKAKDAVKDLYRELVSFNIAQVPAEFGDVISASIRMGMSFDDTVKFLQENKRLLAIYGPDQFKGAMGSMKSTFQKFGYNMAQASKIVGPAIEAGISSGLNIRSPEQLNNFIDSTMKSFQKISGIVDITADEYFKLNAELLNQEDIQGTLLGLGQQAAQERSKEIIALRDQYLALGLSKDQANALAKAQQAQQREKVTSRIKEAAKGMVLAQQAGLSPEQSQRYFTLAMKGNRTTAETKELQEISTAMAKGTEERRVAEYERSQAAGLASDALSERLELAGELGKMFTTGKEIATKERAGVPQTEEEAKRTEALAKGNESIGFFSNIVNSVNSILESSLVKALTSSGLALIGLTANAFLAASSLGSLSIAAGGKSILGLISGGFTGLFSKLGGGAAATTSVIGRLGPILSGTLTTIGTAATSLASKFVAAGPALAGIVTTFSTTVAAAGTAIAGAFSTVMASLASFGSGLMATLAGIGPILSKLAAPVAVAATAIKGFMELSDIEKKQKSGEISERDATVKKSGVLGGVAAGGAAGIIGAGIGQVLIPIPGVGAVVGGAVGAALGGWLGKEGGEAIAGAVVPEEKAPITKVADKTKPTAEENTPTAKTVNKESQKDIKRVKTDVEQVGGFAITGYEKGYDLTGKKEDADRARMLFKKFHDLSWNMSAEQKKNGPTAEMQQIAAEFTQLADKMKSTEYQKSLAKPAETKPIETKPIETKPAKPAETKPIETKPALEQKVVAPTPKIQEGAQQNQDIKRVKSFMEQVGGFAITGYEKGYDLTGKKEDAARAQSLFKKFHDLSWNMSAEQKKNGPTAEMQQIAAEFTQLADKMKSAEYQKTLAKPAETKPAKPAETKPIETKPTLEQKVSAAEPKIQDAGKPQDIKRIKRQIEQVGGFAIAGYEKGYDLTGKKEDTDKAKSLFTKFHDLSWNMSAEQKKNGPTAEMQQIAAEFTQLADKMKSTEYQKSLAKPAETKPVKATTPTETKSAAPGDIQQPVEAPSIWEKLKTNIFGKPATTVPATPAPLSIAEPQAQPTNQQTKTQINKGLGDVEKKADSDILNVSDTTASEKLERIASGIHEAVKLLQTISQGNQGSTDSAEKSKPFSLSDMKPVAPGFSYLSGRAW